MYFDQEEYEIRCEWGLEGVRRLAPISSAVIIVDVLSFSTNVDLVMSRGGRVYPYAWRDERSVEFARERGAILAVGSRKDPLSFSLAPSSMLRLPQGAVIVLPSPNGATLSLAGGETPIFAGCLRNARAVAQAAQELGPTISVIPAGERWPDGSLRPALEDLLGAGAIIQFLGGKQSPEAEAAQAAYLHFSSRIAEVLAACSSGKESADRGSVPDVTLAAEVNTSIFAPRLVNGAYQ
jgi:2-phosphosulfolactate phosphatase